MEEVWKNVHLSSLSETTIGIHDHHDHHHNKMDGQDGLMMRCRETSIEKIVENDNPGFISSLDSPFAEVPTTTTTFACPSFLLGKLCSKNKRRGEFDQHQNDEFRGDRRYKRMMKNRESAARSRARRQAYTNELELEVAQLTEENAKLRKEQETLKLFAQVEAPPKKAVLCRSLTAPF